MTYYNLSFMDNTTNIVQIATGVNDASNGWLFGLILFMLWLLIFMVFKNYDQKGVWVGSSFIVSLAGGALFGAGLLEWWVLILPVVVLMISIIIKLWSDA